MSEAQDPNEYLHLAKHQTAKAEIRLGQAARGDRLSGVIAVAHATLAGVYLELHRERHRP